MKEKIVKVALKIFSSKGFHGTSIREISAAANVSLPTIYYYFKDKTNLFEEVVANEFFKLHKKMQVGIKPTGSNPAHSYAQGIIAAKRLNKYERDVLAMAIKVGLGFDGVGSIHERIRMWEKERNDQNKSFLSKFVNIDFELEEDFVSLLVDITEHMMIRIILLGEDIPDEAITKRFELLFKCIT